MALDLTYKIAKLDKEDIKQAQASRGLRYSGPTPPPGTYRCTLKKVWAGTKGDELYFRVLYEINELEDTTYNGCPIFDRLVVPVDKDSKYFGIQVNAMNDFAQMANKFKNPRALSLFVKAINDNKMVADGEKDRIGIPVKSIGATKFDGSQVAYVVIKLADNPNDPAKPYINPRYIDIEKTINSLAADDDDEAVEEADVVEEEVVEDDNLKADDDYDDDDDLLTEDDVF